MISITGTVSVFRLIILRKRNGMAASLEKQVEALLQEGESKAAILKKLKSSDNQAKLIYHLNNKSVLSRRHRFMWVNLMLAALLLFMTLKRLLAISSAGHFDFYLLADFIVPTINFYILREILLFQRTGYLFLTVLTCLALLYAQNWVLPDLIINIAMIGLAVFFYFRLFPKNELLALDKKS